MTNNEIKTICRSCICRTNNDEFLSMLNDQQFENYWSTTLSLRHDKPCCIRNWRHNMFAIPSGQSMQDIELCPGNCPKMLEFVVL